MARNPKQVIDMYRKLSMEQLQKNMFPWVKREYYNQTIAEETGYKPEVVKKIINEHLRERDDVSEATLSKIIPNYIKLRKRLKELNVTSYVSVDYFIEEISFSLNCPDEKVREILFKYIETKGHVYYQ